MENYKEKIKNKLLIADDEEPIREMLGTMFESLGYECALARNGQEVLDLISSQKFDAIIMDLKMPQIDGIQVIEEIFKINKPLLKKIILITGELISRGMTVTVLSHNVTLLKKPFKISDLEVLVTEKVNTPL